MNRTLKKSIRKMNDQNSWWYIKKQQEQQEEEVKKYKPVICRDGFTMSIQAGVGMYSKPRTFSAEHYQEVEIGYPSAKESLILEYAEVPSTPTDTVYAYVPVHIVTLVIAKHGGMVSGEVPPGVIVLPA